MTASPGTWNMLYAATTDQSVVVAALIRALTVSGYQVYDAYSSAFPPVYAQVVRSFVARPVNGWTRILGEVDPAIVPLLSAEQPVLEARVTLGASDTGAQASLAVWLHGRALDINDTSTQVTSSEPGWLASIIAGIARLNAPKASASASSRPDTAATDRFVPREALPGSVRGLFDTLDPEQAGSLFDRMTASLASRFGRAQMDAARSMLQPRAIDWTAGQPAILAEILSGLYDGSLAWRDPDFVTLRDAYQLHIRQRERPGAPLYPGDAEALAAVPDALNYVPVYAGRSA